MEVLTEVKKIAPKPFKIVKESRREGDPAKLVASHQKASEILGWKPKKTLKDIISSAF